ncbi:hypothetical protein GLOTRDRAFT_94731 [Gloeophyllum trabeum ATCC 11539]|uniref:Uncharacterized protein n=1 Tax=Gloeophyllum trabeum (strain ATCC 11539 / FP-39264 / Madison 617) TaxID=670483 RepID=S7RLG5_GLOTA|nr:uncharacterized protein GLOTRDRAFT_94731 [Gloeophyllum trabeum ATCC 11539]EPQ53494.1 hypothetical protein GLOTRDRAFT_94731 [Gloeophyllum trabeum ATCC 11539]
MTLRNTHSNSDGHQAGTPMAAPKAKPSTGKRAGKPPHPTKENTPAPGAQSLAIGDAPEDGNFSMQAGDNVLPGGLIPREVAHPQGENDGRAPVADKPPSLTYRSSASTKATPTTSLSAADLERRVHAATNNARGSAPTGGHPPRPFRPNPYSYSEACRQDDPPQNDRPGPDNHFRCNPPYQREHSIDPYHDAPLYEDEGEFYDDRRPDTRRQGGGRRRY